MEKFINVGSEIYSLKFGTKCLIQLKEFSKNISDQELINLKFYLAIQHNNDMTYEGAMTILNQITAEKGVDYVEGLLCEVLDLSIGEKNADFYLHMEELYRKAVGEMGIAPHIFYEMSPKEITLAYKGYIDRKQLEANCFLIAIRKAKDKEATLLNLLEENKEYTISTNQEREQVFQALNIE